MLFLALYLANMRVESVPGSIWKEESRRGFHIEWFSLLDGYDMLLGVIGCLPHFLFVGLFLVVQEIKSMEKKY